MKEYTIKEYAKKYGFSEYTVRKMIKKGELNTRKEKDVKGGGYRIMITADLEFQEQAEKRKQTIEELKKVPAPKPLPERSTIEKLEFIVKQLKQEKEKETKLSIGEKMENLINKQDSNSPVQVLFDESQNSFIITIVICKPKEV